MLGMVNLKYYFMIYGYEIRNIVKIIFETCFILNIRVKFIDFRLKFCIFIFSVCMLGFIANILRFMIWGDDFNFIIIGWNFRV
jgi:hypothetical protein